MARRKKSSAFEDVIELVAMLPWWAGVVLALIFYLWLHYVASQPLAPSPTNLKQLGGFVGNQLWHTLATFLQYLIPLVCLIGAGASAYQRYKGPKPQHEWSSSPTHREKYLSDIGGARNSTESAPDCPQCGALMVKRMAKKGSRAGIAFWGCSMYPGCRGTKAASE